MGTQWNPLWLPRPFRGRVLAACVCSPQRAAAWPQLPRAQRFSLGTPASPRPLAGTLWSHHVPVVSTESSDLAPPEKTARKLTPNPHFPLFKGFPCHAQNLPAPSGGATLGSTEDAWKSEAEPVIAVTRQMTALTQVSAAVYSEDGGLLLGKRRPHSDATSAIRRMPVQQLHITHPASGGYGHTRASSTAQLLGRVSREQALWPDLDT